MLTFVRTCNTSACYVTSWVGWGGVGMLTFVRTCNTSACYVTSWVGWGGDVDVRENLQHIRMLRNFLGWVGWGGDVDVRENLQHIRMLRNFFGGVGWVPFYPAGMMKKIYIFFFPVLHILLYLFFTA